MKYPTNTFSPPLSDLFFIRILKLIEREGNISINLPHTGWYAKRSCAFQESIQDGAGLVVVAYFQEENQTGKPVDPTVHHYMISTQNFVHYIVKDKQIT